jgi:hypothetical protein
MVDYVNRMDIKQQLEEGFVKQQSSQSIASKPSVLCLCTCIADESPLVSALVAALLAALVLLAVWRTNKSQLAQNGGLCQ